MWITCHFLVSPVAPADITHQISRWSLMVVCSGLLRFLHLVVLKTLSGEIVNFSISSIPFWNNLDVLNAKGTFEANAQHHQEKTGTDCSTTTSGSTCSWSCSAPSTQLLSGQNLTRVPINYGMCKACSPTSPPGTQGCPAGGNVTVTLTMWSNPQGISLE